MDSVIGKLRAIFADGGREIEWHCLLGVGNPAADRSVKSYLASVTGLHFGKGSGGVQGIVLLWRQGSRPARLIDAHYLEISKQLRFVI